MPKPRTEPLPMLRQLPAPKRSPEEMMREIHQNKIVMRQRFQMSSRGQCVKLPPIPGSSRYDSSDLRQSFETDLRRQDNLIKSLVDELSEQRQSELARASHRQKVNNLLKFHLSQLEEQELDFKTSVEERRSDTERELILLQREEERAYLNGVSRTFSMQRHYAKIVDEARRDYERSREQIKKQYKDEYQKMKKQMKEVLKKPKEEERRERLGPREKRISSVLRG